MADTPLHSEPLTTAIRAARPRLARWRPIGVVGGLAILCILGLAVALVPQLRAASAWPQQSLLIGLMLVCAAAGAGIAVALRGMGAPARNGTELDAPDHHMLEDAIESLGEGVALYGPDDRLVWCNRRFRELRSVNPLSCQIGAHFADILRSAVACGELPMPPEGIEAWVRTRVAERRHSARSTMQHCIDRWIRVTDRVTRDGSVIGIHADVTEMKVAEAAAEAARARVERQTVVFSTLIENLRVGVSLIDADGRFMAFNHAFRELYDLPPDRVKVGDTFESFMRYLAEHGDFPGEDVEETVSRRVARAMSGEAYPFERTRPNGRVIEIRRAPLPGGGFVGTFIDVTDARRREAERDEARARLERQTDAFSTLIENVPVGVSLIDAGGRFAAFNRMFFEVYDLAPDTFKTGDTFESFVRYLAEEGDFGDYADVETTVRELVARVMGRDPYVVERKRANGRVLQIIRRPLRSGGCVVAYIDVTEARRREAAVQEAQARLAQQTDVLSTLIENLEVGVSLVDGDGRFMAFNHAYRDLYHLPPDLFEIGATFQSHIRYLVETGDFLDDGDVEATVRRVVDNGMRPVPQHFERTRRNGGVLEFRRTPLPGGGFVTTHIDVTEARRREAAVQEAQARLTQQTDVLSTLIENLKVGVALVDGDGRLMALNQAYLELFDIPRETFKSGDTYEAVIRYLAELGDFGDEEDVEATVSRWVALAMRPEPQAFERTRRDGTVVEIRRTPLPGGGFVTTYIDVTEARRREVDLHEARTRLEQQATELVATAHGLHAANAAKSLFLANMSHELRTPLNAILGFSEIMRDAMLGPLDSRYRNYSNDIHRSGAYLLGLISDILDTAKIDAGQMRLEQDRIDLVELVGECERLLLERAQGGDVSVAYEIGRSLPLIVGDRLRIKQVLLNLLVNAIKFTPAGGKVRLSAAASREQGVSIVITDTGVGMEPASIARALEPFQQIDNRLARRYEGSGLGLPLAKSLVELHGGKLTIESELGKGTRVHVWLPPQRVLDEYPAAPAAGHRLSG